MDSKAKAVCIYFFGYVFRSETFPPHSEEKSTFITHKILVFLGLNQCFKVIQFKKEKFFLSFLVQLHIAYKPSSARNKCLQIPKKYRKPLPSFSSQSKKQNYGVSYFKNILNMYIFISKRKKQYLIILLCLNGLFSVGN